MCALGTCNAKGVCVWESDSALGGEHAFQVLRYGDLQLVVTEVVSVSSVMEEERV